MRGALEWLSLCRRGRRYLPLYSALTAAGAALLPRPLTALSALALAAPWLTLAANRAWPAAQTANLRGAPPEDNGRLPDTFVSSYSVMVFHAPQAGHFPIQRGYSFPHCVQ